MKKSTFMLAICLLLCCLCACAVGAPTDGTRQPNGETQKPGGTQTPPSEKDDAAMNGEILVVYFSCTNTTRTIADYVIEKTGGARYSIQPKIPYTEDDLKYYTNGRADREQADPAARPEIEGSVESMSRYQTVFIGYPIWHGQAPKIIYTFLESYDFSGKTIIPFCTSHSSGVGSSDKNLHLLAPNAQWKEGVRFAGSAGKESVFEWVDGLHLEIETEKESMQFYLTVGSARLAATLADNAATAALKERLKDAPLTLDARDYGGFEKVGNLGFDLPTDNERITAQPCEFVLYEGNKLVIFYGPNSWSYTRLGKITGVTAERLKELFGGGDVRITLSLE